MAQDVIEDPPLPTFTVPLTVVSPQPEPSPQPDMLMENGHVEIRPSSNGHLPNGYLPNGYGRRRRECRVRRWDVGTTDSEDQSD